MLQLSTFGITKIKFIPEHRKMLLEESNVEEKRMK